MAAREEKLRLVTAAVVKSSDDGRSKGGKVDLTVNSHPSPTRLTLFVLIFFHRFRTK